MTRPKVRPLNRTVAPTYVRRATAYPHDAYRIEGGLTHERGVVLVGCRASDATDEALALRPDVALAMPLDVAQRFAFDLLAAIDDQKAAARVGDYKVGDRVVLSVPGCNARHGVVTELLPRTSGNGFLVHWDGDPGPTKANAYDARDVTREE